MYGPVPPDHVTVAVTGCPSYWGVRTSVAVVDRVGALVAKRLSTVNSIGAAVYVIEGDGAELSKTSAQ